MPAPHPWQEPGGEPPFQDSAKPPGQEHAGNLFKLLLVFQSHPFAICPSQEQEFGQQTKGNVALEQGWQCPERAGPWARWEPAEHREGEAVSLPEQPRTPQAHGSYQIPQKLHLQAARNCAGVRTSPRAFKC